MIALGFAGCMPGQTTLGPATPSMETVELLGVRFHTFCRQELLQLIMAAAQQSQKTIVANVNIRAMNLAYELDWFREFLNRSDFVFCDGFGVVLGARIMGQAIKAEHRHTPIDWIEPFVVSCAQQGLSIFFLAGQPGIAEAAVEKFKTVAPGLKAATHHGYFQKSGPENEAVIADINAFAPHILCVGFGMPLQEEWIQHNIDRVEARVFFPIGGCLDFYTGRVSRGPLWLTNSGFEWLTRLFYEPRRLWRRYLVGNPLFLARVLKHRFKGTG